MTSNTMGEIHASHQGHKLVQKSYKKPYICDGCKEPGIGSRHRCEDCDYNLHEHCMFYKSTTRHDFFPNSTFKFLLRPPGQDKRWCDGCGKPVRGFVYHCKEEGLDLHPCCMKLPNNPKIDDVEFKLRDKVLKRCFWCNKKKLEGSASWIKGWSYVSKCDKYHFHVNCILEMILQGSKNGSSSNNDYNDQTAPGSLALALENLERPIQGRNGGRSSGDKVISIMKMLFKVVLGILLGDPVTITLAAVGFFFENGKRFSTQNKAKQHKKLTRRPENIEKTSHTPTSHKERQTKPDKQSRAHAQTAHPAAAHPTSHKERQTKPDKQSRSHAQTAHPAAAHPASHKERQTKEDKQSRAHAQTAHPTSHKERQTKPDKQSRAHAQTAHPASHKANKSRQTEQGTPSSKHQKETEQKKQRPTQRPKQRPNQS